MQQTTRSWSRGGALALLLTASSWAPAAEPARPAVLFYGGVFMCNPGGSYRGTPVAKLWEFAAEFGGARPGTTGCRAREGIVRFRPNVPAGG